MMLTRSQSRSTSARMWLESSTVRPRSRKSSTHSWKTDSISGSRPDGRLVEHAAARRRWRARRPARPSAGCPWSRCGPSSSGRARSAPISSSRRLLVEAATQPPEQVDDLAAGEVGPQVHVAGDVRQAPVQLRRRRATGRRRAAAPCPRSLRSSPSSTRMVVDLPDRWVRGSRAPRPRSTLRSRPSSARNWPNVLDQALDLDRGAHRSDARASTGRRTRQALVTSTRIDCASRIAWSSTARRGSGTGSHGSTTRIPRQPRIGQHLVDGRAVAAGHQRPRPQDAGRVVGRGLVGLPRLVVAAPGEALLALAAGLGAALHVPLADLVLDQLAHRRAGRPRSRPCGRAARPTPPARRPPREAATSGTPSYAAANGSRAVNVEPSSASPRSAPSSTGTTSARAGPRSCRPSARGARAGRGRRARSGR